MSGEHKLKYVVGYSVSYLNANPNVVVGWPSAAWIPIDVTPNVWVQGPVSWATMSNAAIGQLQSIRGTTGQIGQSWSLDANLSIRGDNGADSTDINFAFFHNGVIITHSEITSKFEPGDTIRNVTLHAQVQTASINDTFEIRHRRTYGTGNWWNPLYATFRMYMD